MIAWCSKPGHGTRLIPAGALTGVQFLKTPDYIQIVGFINQTQIDMADGDYGGEMDPHGADFVCLVLLAPMVIYSDGVVCLAWEPFGRSCVFEELHRGLCSSYRMDKVRRSISLRSSSLRHLFLSLASWVVMPSVSKPVTPLVLMPHSSVNISTTVSAVPIMLPTLLKTRSLKPALLTTPITQVSTPQMVSSKPTLNHPSLSAQLLLYHIPLAFLLPPTVKLSLVEHCFLAYLLRLLRLLLVRPRVPPPGPRDNLEPRLMLPDLLQVPLPMRLPLPFLVSRLLVSYLLLFSYCKGQFGDEALKLDGVGYDVSALSTVPHSQSLYHSIIALIR